MLKVNEKFPDFKLKNQDGREIALKQFQGKWVVVYFYPKDDTPGCTIQGKSFTASKEDFDLANVVVLGVSEDDVNSHKDFCNKFSFAIDLLADTDHTLQKACGIGQTEFAGKMYWDRTSFVIDPEGHIRKIYEKVKPEGHEQVLLDDIELLKQVAVS